MNSKEKMTPDEKWDNATLANNFIFYKVMRNHPEAYKHFFIRAEALQKPTAIPLKNNKQHNVAC